MEHLMSIEPRSAQRQKLELVHSRGYIDSIKSRCENGVTLLDGGDTIVSPLSYSVALQAAGGIVRAVEMIYRREILNAFCAVRPTDTMLKLILPRDFACSTMLL